MMLVAIALAIRLHCACHHEPNSCRFIGSVGQRFTYEGAPYVVPRLGSVELISDEDDQCTSSPRATKVSGDAFGTWTMRLPDGARR